MGRRRKMKSIEVKINIPEETYFAFERRLTNDFRNKPEYGIRSQLITALIIKWLEATSPTSPIVVPQETTQ